MSSEVPAGAPVSLEVHDGWGRVRLGPGRAIPVLGTATLDALDRTIQAAREARLTALVLTGGTGSVFAAGADLREIAALTPLAALAFSRRGQALLDRVRAYPGATIAAVRGRCLGGAFDLVMACDLRCAGSEASFEHPGPRMGFITGYAGTRRLPALAPRLARRALLGIESIDAETARRDGLVSLLSEEVDPEPAACDLARRFARLDPAAVSRLLHMKQALRVAVDFARPRTPLRRLGDLVLRAGG